MNVALFLNRDIYCSVVVNHLARKLAEHQVRMFVSDRVGGTKRAEALELLGLVEQGIPFDIVFPTLEEPGELSTPRLIEREYGFRSESMNTPNDTGSIAKLRALDLDIVVSIRYGRIFKDEFLALPRLGVLNLHSGILPDYRGVMASFHAIAAGATELGCTLHYIDAASIDTGPVVADWRRPVDPELSYFGHVLSLYEPGAELVMSALETLARAETLETVPQSHTEGAYFTFPNDDDVARFQANGHRLYRSAEVRELLGLFRVAQGT